MHSNKEIWKDITGYEGVYRVSRKGQIFSVHKNDFKESLVSKRGYHTVQLWKDGKRKTATVHRLIAIAFIPKVKGKTQINHINGIKTDNRIENLEWCSHGDNMRHATKTGLNHSGVKHPMARFSEKDVRKIRRLYEKDGINRVDISRMYNCSFQSINNIVKYISYQDAV